jgi:hypothetical protein
LQSWPSIASGRINLKAPNYRPHLTTGPANQPETGGARSQNKLDGAGRLEHIHELKRSHLSRGSDSNQLKNLVSPVDERRALSRRTFGIRELDPCAGILHDWHFGKTNQNSSIISDRLAFDGGLTEWQLKHQSRPFSLLR